MSGYLIMLYKHSCVDGSGIKGCNPFTDKSAVYFGEIIAMCE